MNEVKRKIGGTQISRIFGLSRWGGPMDAYLSLTEVVEDEVNSEASYWGKESQPAILSRYNKETGRNMIMCDITYQHPLYDFITFTPDALEVSGFEWPKSSHIVELKQTSVRDLYGESGTDQVSDETALQCQLYMGCCGAQTCDVAVHFLRPRHEFAIFPLTFNHEIFDNIIEKAREFWHENVLKKIPPPIDASAASKKLLNHLYPKDMEDLFAGDSLAEALAQNILFYERQRDNHVEKLTFYQNHMKDLIGDHAGVVTSFGKVTWKRSKDTQVVDWKAAFDTLLGYFDPTPEQHEKVMEIIDYNTQIRPGSRRFVTKWNKEDA